MRVAHTESHSFCIFYMFACACIWVVYIYTCYTFAVSSCDSMYIDSLVNLVVIYICASTFDTYLSALDDLYLQAVSWYALPACEGSPSATSG